MIRRPPRSTLSSSSAASDVYKRQMLLQSTTPSAASSTATASRSGCARSSTTSPRSSPAAGDASGPRRLPAGSRRTRSRRASGVRVDGRQDDAVHEERGAGSGVLAAALARQAEVLLGQVDADGAAAQLPSHEHRRPGAAERVAEVEPERARGLQHPAQLGGDGAEGGHVVLPAALGADAAAGVAAVAEVRRAGEAAVHGGVGKEAQRLEGVTAEEE